MTCPISGCANLLLYVEQKEVSETFLVNENGRLCPEPYRKHTHSPPKVEVVCQGGHKMGYFLSEDGALKDVCPF